VRRFSLLALAVFAILMLPFAATGVYAATRPWWLPAPTPKPAAKPAKPAPPAVSAPIEASASDPVGTVLLLHQGAWAGPDHAKQEALLSFPGQAFVNLGWRAVSVDYAAGEAGLQSVKDAVGVEVLRSGDRPVCLYGESAGGHLALLAAAQIPSVDCVIAFGAPTDFELYSDAVHKGGDVAAIGTYESKIVGTFGEPGAATAAWEPAKVANLINADVLMVRQGDDQLVPPNQVTALKDVLPTVSTLVTAVGDLLDPSEKYMHGTLDDTARNQLLGAISSFTKRAVANAAIARWGRGQHCAGANAPLSRSGPVRFRRAVACLVARQRRHGSAARAASVRTTTVTVVGQVTPARAVRAVIARSAGLRALRASGRLAGVRVRQTSRSRVAFGLR
jgi:acetyl esterase/lipase